MSMGSLLLRLSVTALRGAVVVCIARHGAEELGAGYFTVAKIVVFISVICGMETFQVVVRRMMDAPLESPQWTWWQLRGSAVRAILLAAGLGVAVGEGWVSGGWPILVGLLAFFDSAGAELGRWLIAAGRVWQSNLLMLGRSLWTVPVIGWLMISPATIDFGTVLTAWIAAAAAAVAACLWRYRHELPLFGPLPGSGERAAANRQAGTLFLVSAAVMLIELLPLLFGQVLPPADLAALGFYLAIGGLVQTGVTTAVWQPGLRSLAAANEGARNARLLQASLLRWGAAGVVVAAGLGAAVAATAASDAYLCHWDAGAVIIASQAVWVTGVMGHAHMYALRRDRWSAACGWSALAAGAVVALWQGVGSPMGAAWGYAVSQAVLAGLRWGVVAAHGRSPREEPAAVEGSR